jgi:hypothetical protein
MDGDIMVPLLPAFAGAARVAAIAYRNQYVIGR